MGKGTDKLYVTHSEWADDTFASSSGSGASRSKAPGASFRRLPFNFCAISLQPFSHPVCTSAGTTFDLTHILPWIKKHGTNPVDGTPLKSSELIKLNFQKNETGEYVDPVTYKALTDNTHVVALRNTGNVFAWDTIDRLNIKTKNWHDLVSEVEFTRKDIITLQDPQNLESRDLSSFKFLKDGSDTLTDEQKRERADPTSNVNLSSIGNAAKILKAKEVVAKARADRVGIVGADRKTSTTVVGPSVGANGTSKTSMPPPKAMPYNAAQHTTGKAAASFTSTGLTPHTSNERALLSEEEYMLKEKRVKQKGYARIQTNLGDMNIELQTEFAPKAVWNFVRLSKKGYYRNMNFHRNIRSFMIQGGDPTGTGRGGQSIWGKPFADEYGHSSLSHDARGIISMANKGKNTNTSQFFITYRPAKHLDRKHTIFGRVINNDANGESMETLNKLEAVKTEDSRPIHDCIIEDIVVFVDPFEEFQKSRTDKDIKDGADAAEKEATEDDVTTWSGKRIRADGKVEEGSNGGTVGKYFDAVKARDALGDVTETTPEAWEELISEPPAKKRKGGFGNFDNW